MKLTITAAITFFSLFAHAAPPLDLGGHNNLGERIRVVGESAGQSHSEILVQIKDKKLELKGQRCGYSDDHTTFSCSTGGDSPLAGATFMFKAEAPSSRTVDCGRIAGCERGCGPRTPKELLESGNECYDVADCPNPETREAEWTTPRTINGTVKGNNVKLRDNPHSQSRALRTVAEGVRVRITYSTITCTLVNGQPGAWVFVTVLDDNLPQRGWMFDANIKFHKSSNE